MTTAGEPENLDLDRGAGHHIEAALVPDALRPLIPFVERWAFDSLDDQDVFAGAMLRERPNEVKAFNMAIDAHRQAIVDWGRQLGFPDKHKSDISDNEWQHPYWLFQTLFKVREATESGEITPEIAAFRERVSAELRRDRFAGVAADADAAFRGGDFARCIELLSSYGDMLGPAQKAKLALARKKHASSPWSPPR